MHLTKMAITNHSRIQDLEMDVRRHAVIVGANDVGKSSILRLLNLMLGTSTAGLYQALAPSDLRDPEQPLVVSAWWSGFTDESRRPFPSEISIADDQVSEYLWVQMAVEQDPDDDEAVNIRRWFPEGGHERAPSREQLEAFGWRYLKATRGASMMDGAHSPVRALLSAANLGNNEDGLKSLLNQFNDELAGNESVSDLLERVAGHLSRSMPRTLTKDDFAVRSVTDPSSDVLQDVSIFLNRGDAQVTLMEQSDGVRQLMSMTLFDLAEGAANVIAIDEPEIHLHPTSQRTAADLLSGDGNQKIIATHSPYILHRFEPAEVIAVDRHGHCHQIGDARLSRVEKVRAHWWSPRLLEALTARYVILVEGSADRVIVEGVARALDVDLDRIGAVVVELDGAEKFKNVFPLLGPDGFGPTLLGLVDQRESAPWVNAFGGKPRDVIDAKVFISVADLEDEYTIALGGPASAKALIDSGFCREDAILQAAGVGTVDQINPAAVAKYCRDKGKVDSATCIAEVLTVETAAKIGSVSRLMRVLDGLSKQ
ncbi:MULTISPECIES: ATP-binding protein [unclassified Leifsonia]|uniref:ATP-dependent nuclease n=1 Tax=unclassified Leifsonia TaxID=2663824 RepID=UPI0008A7432F|nr:MULTISPECIES: ATP-binding protein [unclassified Leifsonia]SEI11383.1 putative ATP-dependent endonuclease of the OLD family [Leifsonia sp. CL154]SFL88549.1 putative ATP-dependent endonuclease of the OLD family [Leifsonia sp. CL147]